MANPLTTRLFTKGRLLPCKKRPFALPFAAFRKAVCGISLNKPNKSNEPDKPKYAIAKPHKAY